MISALIAIMVLTGAQASGSGEDALGQARAAATRVLAFNAEKNLQSAAAKALVAGELAGMTGDSIGQLDPTPNAVVLIDPDHAVARTSAQPPDGLKIDVYLYLSHSDTTAEPWQLTAVRALAMPKFFFDLRRGLQTLPDLSDEQRIQLENIDLTVRTDAELRTWFAAHARELRRLATLASAGRKPASKELLALARRLRVSDVTSDKGVVDVLIGGITDNSVGFLYSPRTRPPAITTYEYIWVEQVAKSWYLYRTT